MTRKLSYQPWQVPPSSVGRVLYRKSCPSQDGDPVPGSLPVFCSISCWTLFLILILLTACCKVYPLFYTLKLTTCIETLMNLNIITLNHKGFILPSSWSQNALSLEPLPLFIAVLCPPVTYNLKILLSFHGKFPAAQWVEHCTAKAVPVRMEILTRGTCCFVLDFFFLTLFMFFFLLNLPFYSQECPFLLVFSLQCIIGGLLPLTGKFILYLQCQIEDMHRNVAGFEHYYI